MKVIYLHQYFKTPSEGGAIRSYYLAKAMVEHGWQVQVITAHDGPEQTTEIDGIHVHYLSVPYDNSFSTLQRVKAFRSFSKKAYSIIKKVYKADFIYATSTPLSVGEIALKAQKRLGIPYIFEVRDLWPEAPIQLGVMKNRLMRLYFRRLEKTIYEQASKLIALSPGIKSGIIETIKGKKILMAPNMCDMKNFRPSDVNNVRPKLLYNGAIGKANAPSKIISLVKENPLIDFYFMAKGACLQELKDELHSLENVTFIPFGSKKELQKVYEEIDITLTSFLDLPVLETCSANKFFDSLAAGKVTLVNVGGWMRDLVEKNYCGFYVDGETNLTQLLAPHNLKELKQNAHNLASQFHKDDVCHKVIEFIEK